MKKNLNGLNQLNENLEKHTPFGLYDDDGLFAIYEYDKELNRYQSNYGYLLLSDVYKIMKDNDDSRYILWKKDE